MKAREIRSRFLEYFRERGHEVVPSSSLVPQDDPTLLFTNAGMVQFKGVFLGQEKVPYRRAATAQKCVRAGGKHNDLEEVGQTARHHTFFEMLGNFSFGDYFKREACEYAWELLTAVYGLDPGRLYVTVHHTDEEAASLWEEVVGVDAKRIYRLGDKDNFWQMAETGPCGPCSELHYDLRAAQERRQSPVPATDDFVAQGEAGLFVELWNLVFMQFERDASGVVHPLPAPSIDTGAGLERLTAVLQGVESNYDTDLFLPLLEQVGEVTGVPYDASQPGSAGHRVIADHARAVAFLLAEGVFPSKEGRGYVLRRILRRAVRHAWLLGRREPTLVDVVDVVVDLMGEAYPELTQRREHLLRVTLAEEDRFLATIEGGLWRFDELAPAAGVERESRTIPGEEAFKLYDTFGFPLDLTQVMARERGHLVDDEGFQRALDEQRERSRADRARSLPDSAGAVEMAWITLDEAAEQEFVGYQSTEVETDVLGLCGDGDRVGVQLRANPFYLEAGGQVSDKGEVEGVGWLLNVNEVRKIGDRVTLIGALRGVVPETPVALTAHARVFRDVRHDTERNHTATHLLHGALREVLGEHVVQRGSLVAPDRLRFDFAHTAPVAEAEKLAVEERVNQAIWADHPVRIHHLPYREAVARGAMALFGEKYADVVRMIEVPDVSMELCGGTHVRHTGEIGLFKIVGESGVAAGVRRIEAQTGPGAFRYFRMVEGRIGETATLLRTSPENVPHRAEQLLREKDDLEALLVAVRAGGGDAEQRLSDSTLQLPGGESFTYRAVRLLARDADDARLWGDRFLDTTGSGVALLAAELPGDKYSLFVFVSDDLIGKGLRADTIVKEVAALVDGRGGGRSHMAQAGVGEPAGLEHALQRGQDIVLRLIDGQST